MKQILHENNNYVLRFDRGEEAMQEILNFCKKENITSGWFTAIGAVDHLVVLTYSSATKQFTDHEFKEDAEITGITGNISTFNSETSVHAHGNFSLHDAKSIAGHVKSMKISVTMELMLTKFESPITRTHNETTAINEMA